MPPRNFNIIVLAVMISALCHMTNRRARPAMMVGDAIDMIDSYYVEPVDDRELLIAAMKGMTDTLDRHSEFIPVEDYGTLQDSINQEFTGIGILIEQPRDQTTGEVEGPVRIITPLVGSPAREAGLLPGDEIISVDDVDVRTWDLVDVSGRLKGPVGSTVRITVERAGTPVRMTVARARIEMESVIGDHRDAKDRWVYRLTEAPEIAYVRLTTFGEKTVEELRQVLVELNNRFEGLVLDLRGNGGGLLYAAVAVSDMFLDEGRIVSTKIRGGVVEQVYDAEPGTLVDPEIPVVVLIDGDSASASEIVAAALQDHGRATVVGTRSFGKGTVQNILPLQYGRSALRLTVARYYRPNDKNIHRVEGATEEDDWGVRPDPGMEVAIEPDQVAELLDHWRRASYPLLEVPPSPTAEDESRGAGGSGKDETPTAAGAPPDKSSVLELDPQLRKAVESLRQQDGAPEATPKAASQDLLRPARQFR